MSVYVSGNKIYDDIEEIPEEDWVKIKLDIPKRKYKNQECMNKK